jgi:hypothetical protein
MDEDINKIRDIAQEAHDWCLIDKQRLDTIEDHLDKQDANDVVIRDELLKKIDENKSKFNDAMWAIAMLIIGGLVAGFVYALILR